MPAFIDTRNLINQRINDLDNVRREHIRAVEKITGRPLVIYATAFHDRDKAQASGGEVAIDGSDKLGFDEATANIQGETLDVLLHSPGGSPEAAEGIVALLRSRFKHIRFIVPDRAKSAATMISCAGDAILMDERSELGPIDPQMQIFRGDGVPILASAQGIRRQFELAKESLASNPRHVSAWLPLLQPLAPALLTACEDADRLSKSLVVTWLTRYMFAGEPEAEAREKAKRAADFLGESDNHFSHGRRIGIDDLKSYGIKVVDTRVTPDLRDAIWKLFHVIMWTFNMSPAFKIIENGQGNAFIRQIMIQEMQIQPQQPPRPPGGKLLPGSSGVKKGKRH